jgi:hypothetical protein
MGLDEIAISILGTVGSWVLSLDSRSPRNEVKTPREWFRFFFFSIAPPCPIQSSYSAELHCRLTSASPKQSNAAGTKTPPEAKYRRESTRSGNFAPLGVGQLVHPIFAPPSHVLTVDSEKEIVGFPSSSCSFSSLFLFMHT